MKFTQSTTKHNFIWKIYHVRNETANEIQMDEVKKNMNVYIKNTNGHSHLYRYD